MAWGLGALALLGIVVLSWPGLVPRPLDASDVPPELIDATTRFPRERPDLPVATPLTPLLASDAPGELAILSPEEGAMQLRRGRALSVSFNRPMVRATEVGRELPASPLVLSPPVPGTARWTSRSTLTFTPAPAAFDRNLEAHYTLAPGLRSVDGAELVDDAERVIVCDGTPRASQGRSDVPVGAPLEIVFDAPVSTADLLREMMVFEQGGGARTLPARVRSLGWRGDANEDGDEAAPRSFVVAVDLARRLEPGAAIGIALAPRFSPWSSYEPYVLSYGLEPRPRIDGIDCDLSNADWVNCTYEESPGDIVDIGPELVLRATRALVAGRGTAIVSPPVTGLSVAIDGADPERARYVTIRADWAPDQVYEVRVQGLTSVDSAVTAPPLAVRSRGETPQLFAPSGLLTYEPDARLAMGLRGVHVDAGRVRSWPVPPERAVAEVLGLVEAPATDVPPSELPAGFQSQTLASLIPSARANRWGRGTLELEAPDGPALYRVDFSADGDGRSSSALLLRTDLGISTLGVPGGVLVWVTSLTSTEPVAGATVTSFDFEGQPLGSQRTDDDGVALLLGSDLALRTRVVRAETTADRALFLFDSRSATHGHALGVTGGTQMPEDAAFVRAITRTDRGLYRPGETLHALGLLREVAGVSLRPRADAVVDVTLGTASEPTPYVHVTGRTSALGLIDVTMPVPVTMPLGEATVSLLVDGVVVGSATVRVADYREPRFRVDVEAPAQALANESHPIAIGARHLFGAAVSGAVASVRVTRGGHAAVRGHAGFLFAPTDAAFNEATLSETSLAMSDQGRLELPLDFTLAVPARTEIAIEADVTDAAGQSTAARRTVVVRPADVEVGMTDLPAWIRWGEPVTVEAVAIDGDDANVAGVELEVRFLREGWHSFWEWHATSEGETEGEYAARRAQRRTTAHRCRLVSGDAPSSCTFAPDALDARPGTYLVEVEATDGASRRTLASDRIYIAGPDESPDRDPPGAPLDITPRVVRVAPDGVAELAFECPWPEAEALIVVSQGAPQHIERRHVTAGGHVIRIPVPATFAPNAFVTITLVRPRTGAPAGELDLDAPDLRFGAAEIIVRPEPDPLHVHIEDAPVLAPGTAHEIEITVTDAAGTPVRAELAVWASDEGTLRATAFALGDLDEDLFARNAATFALGDMRTHLRSRRATALEAEASGDGGESGGGIAPRLTERERYEPTPLFVGRVATDAEGRARVPFAVPDRLSEYRVMAVATDRTARVGSATSSRVVSRDLVLRAALPRFVTAGDVSEAQLFVHNRTAEPREVDVSLVVDGSTPRLDETEHVLVPAESDVVVRRTFVAGARGTLRLRASLSSGGAAHETSAAIAIVPRGRWAHEHALVMGTGGVRALEIALPAGVTEGAFEAVVSSHPFVGLPAMIDRLVDTPWSTADLDVARIRTLAAYSALEHGASDDDHRSLARRTELAAAVARTSSRRAADGGIARYAGEPATPALSLEALEALLAARDVGVEVDTDTLDALAQRVVDDVHQHAYGMAAGEAGLTTHARALRVLAEAGHDVAGFAEAAYQTREFLSGAALLDLWLALDVSDARRPTVLALAEDRLGVVRRAAGDVLEPRGRSLRDLAALARVESARLSLGGRTSSGRSLLSRVGSELFAALAIDGFDTAARADAIAALATLAARFVGTEASLLSLRLDGRELTHERTAAGAAHFRVPLDALRDRVAILNAIRGVPDDADHGPVFLSTSARWTVPLAESDEVARGRGVALHRVYETPGGTPIVPGAHIAVGDLVRVRLFVHIESYPSDEIAIRDPHLAGLEAIDAGLASSALSTLRAVLGAGPEDLVTDPRAYHAERTAWAVRQIAHETEATTFFLHSPGTGLHEVTYVVRATTPGTFTAAPAQFEALSDGTPNGTLSARSTSFEVSVDRSGAP